jgi:hypothetical protein
MPRRNDPWKYLNRCIICGSKLQFKHSLQFDKKPEEGVKYCDHNHKRFSIYGGYDDDGAWHTWYRFPQVERK